jgi:adenosine deaminase
MFLKNIPTEFLRRIPKADLHVHLGGSMRLSTLIELAKKEHVKLPAYTEKVSAKKYLRTAMLRWKNI